MPVEGETTYLTGTLNAVGLRLLGLARQVTVIHVNVAWCGAVVTSHLRAASLILRGRVSSFQLRSPEDIDKCVDSGATSTYFTKPEHMSGNVTWTLFDWTLGIEK